MEKLYDRPGAETVGGERTEELRQEIDVKESMSELSHQTSG